MNTTENILAFIDKRINSVFKRPCMHGGTLVGVEGILLTLYEVKSVVLGKDPHDVIDRWRKIHKPGGGPLTPASWMTEEQLIIAYKEMYTDLFGK